ncbi:MAG: hypothetical protein Q7R96_04280 [Nanoarchaeota archaeon]|nr:hypothetical protein [Nanoarchaeota archaeon]
MSLEQLFKTTIISIAGLATLTGCRDEEQAVPQRLSLQEQATQEKKGIPEETLTKYNKERFGNSYQTNWRDCRVELHNQGIPPELANAYHERFSAWAITLLQGKGSYTGKDHDEKARTLEPVAPTTANQYAKRFNGPEVIELLLEKIPSAEANAYDDNFSAWSIIQLHNLGYGNPDNLNTYDQIFKQGFRFREKGEGVVVLAKEKIIPVVANSYVETFHNPYSVIEAVNLKLHWGIAKSYHIEHIFGEQPEGYIIGLWKERVMPEEANIYTEELFRHQRDNRRRMQGIIALHKAGIPPLEANRYGSINIFYGTQIDPEDIVFFKQEKKTYEDILAEAKRLAVEGRILH